MYSAFVQVLDVIEDALDHFEDIDKDSGAVFEDMTFVGLAKPALDELQEDEDSGEDDIDIPSDIGELESVDRNRQSADQREPCGLQTPHLIVDGIGQRADGIVAVDGPRWSDQADRRRPAYSLPAL